MRVYLEINSVLHIKCFRMDVLPMPDDFIDVLNIVSHDFFTRLGCKDVDKCRNWAKVKNRCMQKDKQGFYWVLFVHIKIPHILKSVNKA